MSYQDTLFSGVDKVCPLEAITFNCTVSDVSRALTTRWKGDSRVFDCSDEDNIILLILDDSSPTFTLGPVEYGAATGQLQPPVGDMFTSVLTVVPTLEMSGSEFSVKCAFPRSDVIVINYTASVIGECYLVTARTVMLTATCTSIIFSLLVLVGAAVCMCVRPSVCPGPEF